MLKSLKSKKFELQLFWLLAINLPVLFFITNKKFYLHIYITDVCALGIFERILKMAKP